MTARFTAIKVFLILILLTGTVQAQNDSVYQSRIINGTSGNVVLGAPRRQIVCLPTAGELVTMLNDADSGLYKLTGYGATTSGVLDLNSEHTSNHSMILGDLVTDTIYLSVNTEAGDSLQVIIFDVSGVAPTYLDFGGLAITADTGSRALIAFYSIDTMVATQRMSDETIAIQGYVSPDRGRTWTNLSIINDLYNSASHRHGLEGAPGKDSVVSVGYSFRNTRTDFYVSAIKWSGGSLDTTYIQSQPIQGTANRGYVRDFSVNVDFDNIVHVFVSDTLTPSNIHHIWMHPDSSAWHHDTVWTSSRQEENPLIGAGANRGMQVICEIIEADSTVGLFFTSSKDSSTDSEKPMYWTRWTYADNSWTTPIVVSTVDNISDATGCQIVPASHGKKAYIMYDADDIYLTTVGWGEEEEEEESATILIAEDDLPFTVTDAMHSQDYDDEIKTMDTIAFEGDSLYTTGAVLIINNTSDWFINAADDKIVWGTDSLNNYVCIDYNPSTGDSNLVIHGGRWYHRPDNYCGSSTIGDPLSEYRKIRPTDENNEGSVWLSLQPNVSRKVILDSILYADIMGYKSDVVAGKGAERFLVRACSLYCRTAGFGSRSNFNSTVLDFGDTDTSRILAAQPSDTDYYNVKIDNSYLYCNGQTALYTGGPYPFLGMYQIRNSTFTGGLRNHADTVGSGEFTSTTNSYLIWFQDVIPGSYVTKCSLYAADEYRGFRGITFYTTSPDEGWILFDSNYVYTHESYSSQYELSSRSTAIKIRDGVKYLKIYDNEIWSVADTFDSDNTPGIVTPGDTTPYLNKSSVITFQANTFNDPRFGTYNTPLPWHVKVYNNTLINAYRSNNTTGGYRSNSVYDFDNQLMEDTTTEIYGNKVFYTNSYAIYGHNGFDGAGAFCMIHDDTLYKMDTTIYGVTITNSADTLIGMCWLGDSANYNTLRDIYWAEGGYNNIENNVYHSSYGGETKLCDMTWQRTISILVTDGDDTPLEGATVTITDNYGNIQIDTTTDAEGIATGVVNYRFMSSDIADSTFNNFTLGVSYGEDEEFASFTVDWQNFTDTIAVGEATATPMNIITKGGIFKGGRF